MKNKLLKILSVFFISLIAINNVYANEVVMADNEVLEEGEYDSLRLLAGNKVTSKGIIDGISFVAGNDLSLEGSATYGFYAGNNINIKGTIEKDVFAAGNNIVIDSSAILSRDAYFAGNSIKVNANIARDLRAGGMTVDLSGVVVGRDAYIDAEEIILDEETIIEGVFSYNVDSKVKGLDVAKVGSTKTRTLPQIEVKVDFKDTIYSLIIGIIGGFIVMVALFYILPNTKDRLKETSLKIEDILKTAVIGLLVLIAVPLACIFALFSGILLPISLITLAIYGISLYLSNLLVAYIVGNLINTKLFKNENEYLSLAIGIIVIRVLLLIPLIDGLITTLTILYGLGLIYKYIFNKKLK